MSNAAMTEQPAPFAFSDEIMTQVRSVLSRYPADRKKSAVMPILDLAQRQEGWLTQAAIEHVAEMLDMPRIKVLEVATFYTMYNRQPVGEHHIQVCTNISCLLRGSDDVMRAAAEVFGTGLGEVTADGKASVHEVECLGACANAPMMQINDDYYEDLDYATAKQIFEAIKNGAEIPFQPGSVKGRQCSCPEGGPTTLKGEGA